MLDFIKAGKEHALLLFEWANDGQVRRNAFHTEAISYDTHIKWLSSKLNDPYCQIFICKKDNDNIGQLRLEINGETAVISYSVAKEHRGKGYGPEIIGQTEEIIDGLKPAQNVKYLVGYVKPENIASQRCFEKNGFKKKVLQDRIEYSKKIR